MRKLRLSEKKMQQVAVTGFILLAGCGASVEKSTVLQALVKSYRTALAVWSDAGLADNRGAMKLCAGKGTIPTVANFAEAVADPGLRSFLESITNYGLFWVNDMGKLVIFDLGSMQSLGSDPSPGLVKPLICRSALPAPGNPANPNPTVPGNPPVNVPTYFLGARLTMYNSDVRKTFREAFCISKYSDARYQVTKIQRGSVSSQFFSKLEDAARASYQSCLQRKNWHLDSPYARRYNTVDCQYVTPPTAYSTLDACYASVK